MTIYLDFDGTVVEHEFPRIGRYNYGAFSVVNKLIDAGHDVILNTYRADMDQVNNSNTTQQALNFIERYLEIPLQTTELKINPHPWDPEMWYQTEEIYIDDSAPQMPIKPAVLLLSPMVDWDEVERDLKAYKII